MHIMPIPWHISLADIHPARSRALALCRLYLSRRCPVLPAERDCPLRGMVRRAPSFHDRVRNGAAVLYHVKAAASPSVLHAVVLVMPRSMRATIPVWARCGLGKSYVTYGQYMRSPGFVRAHDLGVIPTGRKRARPVPVEWVHV